MSNPDVVIAHHSANQDTATYLSRLIANADLSVETLSELDFETQFLDQIPVSSKLILLVSDNLLKSEKCLYNSNSNLNLFERNGNLASVIVKGKYFDTESETYFRHTTRIEKNNHIIQYFNYWQSEYLETRQLKGTENDSKVKSINQIVGDLETFFSIIKNAPLEKFEDLENGDFHFLNSYLKTKNINGNLADSNVFENTIILEESIENAQPVPVTIDFSMEEKRNMEFQEHKPSFSAQKNNSESLSPSEIDAALAEIQEADFFIENISPTQDRIEIVKENGSLENIDSNTEIKETEEEQPIIEIPTLAEPILKTVNPIVEPQMEENFSLNSNSSFIFDDIQDSENTSQPNRVLGANDPDFFSKIVEMDRIDSLIKEKKFDEGINALNELINNYPDDINLQIKKARYHLAANSENKEAVKQDLHKIITLSPNNSDAITLLDEISDSDYSENEVFNLTQKDIPSKKISETQFKKYGNAIKHLEKATQLNPKHPYAFFDLAEIYFKIGDFDLAEKHFILAKKNDPSLDTTALNNRFLYPQTGAFTFLDTSDKEEEKREGSLANDKTVFITGASSGIGRATARLFAENGYNLILTGRRKSNLLALEESLKEQYHTDVKVLDFDIRFAENITEVINDLEDEWKNIDLLINNAGLALGFEPIQAGKLEHWDTMIDTNIKGLLYMTRAITPMMIKRGQGQVINICSIAGKEVYPNGNVYCATKAAVNALTKALRIDLHAHNIRVGQVSPSHVEQTDFAYTRYEQNSEKAKIYQDFNPLTAHDVAEMILFMVNQPPHVNILDIDAAGIQQANATIIDRSGRRFD